MRRLRETARCAVSGAILVFTIQLGASPIPLPLVNAGFESGDITGWTFEQDSRLPAYMMSGPAIDRTVRLIGPGIIPGGDGFFGNTLRQDVVMPAASDVRFQFWFQITDFGIGPGWTFPPVHAGLWVELQGTGQTQVFRASIRQSPENPSFYLNLPAGWSVEQVDDSLTPAFEIFSGNLAGVFNPGDTIGVSLNNSLENLSGLGPSGSINHPFFEIDLDRQPLQENMAIASNVFVIPEPGTAALAALGLVSILTFRRRRTMR